jgi:hypothetical protein
MDDDAKWHARFLLFDMWLEAVLFDTGTPINVVDPPTVDKIGIEKYSPAKPLDISGVSLSVPGHLVPNSLPGVVSFVAPMYTTYPHE